MNKPIVTKAGPFWRWETPDHPAVTKATFYGQGRRNNAVVTKSRPLLLQRLNPRHQLEYWLGPDDRFWWMIFGFFFFGIFSLVMAYRLDARPYNGLSLIAIGTINVILRVYLVTRARRRTRAIFS